MVKRLHAEIKYQTDTGNVVLYEDYAALEAAHERNDKWVTEHVAAIEARLAEAETHRDKNRETAISSQQWVNQLEARCVQLEDNLRIAVKVGLDDQARIAQLDDLLRRCTCNGLWDDKSTALEARVRYCECGLPLNGHTHGTRPSQSETAVNDCGLTGAK